MIPLLKLIRIKNLLIIALTQYLMRFCIIQPILNINDFELQFSEFNFALLVITTMLLTAGGYVINDYFDTKTDMVNRPETVVVGTRIKRQSAMVLHIVINSVAVILGFYLSWKIGLYKLGFIYLIIAGILWYYSTNYKRQFLIGNIIVAFLTALVPFMVALYEIPLLNNKYYQILIENNTNFNSIIVWILGFSFFAFITTLIREIIKDIEDFEGDNAFGRNTVPIILGTFYSKIIVLVLIFFTLFSLYFVYFKYITDNITLIYLIVGLSPLFMVLIYKLIKAKDKKDFHFANNLSKIIMLVGILYALIACYQFNQLAN